ncbi:MULTISPECIES: ABC transporter permease [unclassified Mesorhizobium]|jgi:ABC-type spermidine/putrescine transport system permease subunit I|uniref:ABC transporter permease n=1 Tax=unclassified Mesorhizobium TaxID=325217 RepID=UPI00095A0763|nr:MULTISPECIES: ABC transporter permease [unclassified Mesorhizobium]MBN9253321.1 ABC transporter permease [Mesorhizobium sp.]OJX82220.1 MAG: ABC transporter permease [Mesorhizobium sp. 65-26]
MTALNPAASLREADNSAHLAWDARLERLVSFAFTLPCLMVVALCVLVPCAWLFFLSAYGADGRMSLENYQRIVDGASYARIFVTTFQVALATVVACVVIGVPFATFINSLPPRRSVLFLAAVLLPFWTSLLVRAYAWLVLLQRTGIVNSVLMGLGVTNAPLELAFNHFATVLGMTHIMLPIFILPVLGAMRNIDRALIRAAASMGATRGYTFRKVFLPLAAPGIAAGAILVFVMSLGFYVTPAILGGGNVTVISMRIARSLSNYSNWGAASALGVLLLVFTALLFALSYGVQRILLSRQRS